MNRGLKFLLILVVGTLAVGVFGLVTQTLWNWLVPVLFAGPVITFWQALGLLVLSKILFWGFGGKGGGHWRHRGRGPWGRHWSEKWKDMTPEERDRFKQKMWQKWCYPEEEAVKSAPDKESGVSNG